MQKIDLLIYLAKKSDLFNEIEITTINLAKKFDISQQTISNALKDLEEKNLINRKPSYSGITISFKKKGLDKLNSYKNKFNKLIFNKKLLNGKILSGIGEGKFYTQLPKYNKQFINLLKIKPFPGTLNIKCTKEEKEKFLFEKKAIIVKGFKTKERTFGEILCYPIKINGLNGAITVPKRTIHDSSILEIISNYNLREKLKLKDGDLVTIK
ncbi:CTP-dependent riboflavin kinase [Candidatus Woesearchaeota archaeon]|jgi:riboflavin kinase, archaea type|nr:CTP-dependent riboflavin kinase [Candidatus Woesearchaeota archaeon]